MWSSIVTLVASRSLKIKVFYGTSTYHDIEEGKKRANLHKSTSRLAQWMGFETPIDRLRLLDLTILHELMHTFAAGDLHYGRCIGYGWKTCQVLAKSGGYVMNDEKDKVPADAFENADTIALFASAVRLLRAAPQLFVYADGKISGHRPADKREDADSFTKHPRATASEVANRDMTGHSFFFRSLRSLLSLRKSTKTRGNSWRRGPIPIESSVRALESRQHSILDAPAYLQHQSALIASIPVELRVVIWEYVLGPEDENDVLHLDLAEGRLWHCRCFDQDRIKLGFRHSCWSSTMWFPEYRAERDYLPGEPRAGRRLLALLLSCKVIYAKAAEILYLANTFDMRRAASLDNHNGASEGPQLRLSANGIVLAMCQTEITTYYCASLRCGSPNEPYEELIAYKICVPTHYDDEDYHVDRLEQDASKIRDAERTTERKGLCLRCEEDQSQDPARYLAWIRDPASTTTNQSSIAGNVVSFNDVDPSHGQDLCRKLVSIEPPLPSTACPWLCARLELSQEVCALATQILDAVDRGHLDGQHQDPALLGAGVFMAAYLLGERKLKAKEIKRCMKGSHRAQIEAAYALLHGKWDTVLRNRVGGGLRYDGRLLPKPARADWAPRDHWMM
ncbi:hypothetical protein AC579_6613 [Pseudocercospora musae]|uniref:DUF7730 domain-containing protein n=1 Tax=Pseudocercospora musae TaxID=113226 RepID=A0A139I675_9PEZI|nr:hypothetical protein AC579_6613 [Pseudocercospora musae]